MRISIVHSFYSSQFPSGENTVVQMQYHALRQAGHDVQLVAVHTDELVADSHYKSRAAINVITGGGANPSVDLDKFNPDIIHVHNLFPNYSTRWLKTWNGPIVATLHNFRPVCSNGILYRNGEVCTLCPDGSQWNGVKYGCYRGSKAATIPLAIRNRRGVNSDPLLSRADHIVFLSERSKNSYENFGYIPKASSITPNFVETTDIEKTPRNISSEWIYVGRIAPEKGIVDFLKRWPVGEIINVYGDGPDYGIVAAMASENIRVHGLRPRSEVLVAVSTARGLVIPSICAENFPTVYAEALASGVPVIGKSGNAASDDILTAGTGAVFDEWHEIPDLVHCVEQERDGLSLSAVKRFETSFAKDVWVSRILKIYNETIKRFTIEEP